MRRIHSWLTLLYSLLSLLFLAVGLYFAFQGTAYPLAPVAAALCWGMGFCWFTYFGRAAKGRGRLFSLSFCLLCLALPVGLFFCGYVVYSSWIRLA